MISLGANVPAPCAEAANLLDNGSTTRGAKPPAFPIFFGRVPRTTQSGTGIGMEDKPSNLRERIRLSALEKRKAQIARQRDEQKGVNGVKRRLKYVHRQLSHGKPFLYFRIGKGPRIRLPEENSPEFEKHYQAALKGDLVPLYRVTPIELRKQKVERALKSFVPRARLRCAKEGVNFDLDLDWLLAKATAQNHRCALTGIEFFSRYEGMSAKNPFAVSIDRIIPGRGYTRDNVRLVIFAVNLMLLDWGEEVFWQVVRSFQAARRIRKNKGFPL